MSADRSERTLLVSSRAEVRLEAAGGGGGMLEDIAVLGDHTLRRRAQPPRGKTRGKTLAGFGGRGGGSEAGDEFRRAGGESMAERGGEIIIWQASSKSCPSSLS
jgi:hypothetical protein